MPWQREINFIQYFTHLCNRDPGGRVRVVYAVANVVYENSKIVRKEISKPIIRQTIRLNLSFLTILEISNTAFATA